MCLSAWLKVCMWKFHVSEFWTSEHPHGNLDVCVALCDQALSVASYMSLERLYWFMEAYNPEAIILFFVRKCWKSKNGLKAS